MVHRCNGKIYGRSEDGDFDITNHTDTVAMLYMRKQTSFSENRVLPHLTLSDFDKAVMDKVKKMIKAWNPNSPLPARFIIEKTKVITENANRVHGFGHISPDNLVPYSKNPKIARVFREIGRADELGSGVRNIFKYMPIYSKGGEPQLIEEDIFKIIIPLVPDVTRETGVKATRKTGEKIVEKILFLIKENPKITIKQMQKTTGLSRRGVEWNITKVKNRAR